MTSASQFNLYGKGIFTTIAVFGGVPFLFEKHFRRLSENAIKLGIDITDFREGKVSKLLADQINTHALVDGRVRITFVDEGISEIWPTESPAEMTTSLWIVVGERRQMSDTFKLSISAHPINSKTPLVGIKSCNYLEPIMSLDDAKGRGFHEAIRVNERGFVTSACMANVFWLKGGELFTPSLTTGCLAGTTREFVLENIDCREVEVGIEALDDVETVFLTSAGVGVVQVAEFEARRLEKVDHPILHLLPY